jgi:hypothetical protein
MMDIATVHSIMELDKRVRDATEPFYNHSVAGTIYDPALGHVFGEMTLSISDVVLAGALARVHVLLKGPSGCGKTYVASLLSRGLFGDDGWFLQKLNPHLNEDVFCSIDMKRFRESYLHEAIEPAPFLSHACTVLDECNRTPPALTNVLLGFLDGRIELRCGLKFDVGYAYRNSQGNEARYHFTIAAINEGKKFSGAFDMDDALSRRLTLQVPFSELRPTPQDLVDIAEMPVGYIPPPPSSDASEQLAKASDAVLEIPSDPLAKIYSVYLGNIGRCLHSGNGFHPEDGSQDICNKSECRIQNAAAGFCPSVGGLCEAVLKSMKKAACGVCGLRVARTVREIYRTCRQGDSDSLAELRAFAGVRRTGPKLSNAVVTKYLEGVRVTVEDVKTVLPFIGLGGKVWMSREYLAKRFGGSDWMLMKEYVRETYGRLEDFFRQHQLLFARLSEGQDIVAKLTQRLEHAEQFSDPAIRHALTPFLERHSSMARRPGEIAQQIEAMTPVNVAAEELTCG